MMEVPKMKHILQKLHTGTGGFNDHHHRLDSSPPSHTESMSSSSSFPPPAATTSSTDSSTSSSVAAFQQGTRSGLGGESTVTEESADFSFFEEEFQMQLALDILIKHQDSRHKASWKNPEARIISITTRDADVHQLKSIGENIISGKANFQDIASCFSDCSFVKSGSDLGVAFIG